MHNKTHYIKYIFIFIFLFIIISKNIVKSQTIELDSLIKVSKTINNDTNKVILLLKIAKKTVRVNKDTALIFANEALALGKKLKYTKGTASSYRRIGIIYYIKGDYKNAFDNFYNNLKTWQNEKNDYGVARAYNNIGIIHKNIGEYDKALDSYLKSIEIQRKIDDKDGLARSYNNISTVYKYIGKYPNAIEYSIKSLKTHEQLGNSKEMAATYNNIGLIYSKQKNYKKALEYFKKCLDISIKIKNQIDIFNSYNNISELYKQEKNFKKAIEYSQKGLEASKKYEYKKGIALSYEVLASIYFDMKQYEKAYTYYQKVLELQLSIGSKTGIIHAKTGIGSYYIAKKKYNEALTFLQESANLAIEINSLENIQKISKLLSFVHSKLGNYREAYENHLRYKKLGDSLENKASIRKVTQLGMQMEFDKKTKEKEIEQHKKDLESQEEYNKQVLLTKVFILGFIIILLFLIFILKIYKDKKQANIILKYQKEEIGQQHDEIKAQRDEIEKQRDFALKQRDEITKKNKEITDSIQYAKRIQNAILPSRKMFIPLIPDYFIFFKPRDIVSGDFYWLNRNENRIVIAAADCTGHGVPGAFMSMLGISLLNEIVNKIEKPKASQILNLLREKIMSSLHQTGKDGEQKDGMDIAMCVIDTDSKKLSFAGAYNPLYIIRKNNKEYNLIEYKGNKMPIGVHIRTKASFINHEIQLQKDDRIYIFSDGYIDQFGGDQGRKFRIKPFKNLLLSIQKFNMNEQKQILSKTFDDWKKDTKQLDDILLIGMRL